MIDTHNTPKKEGILGTLFNNKNNKILYGNDYKNTMFLKGISVFISSFLGSATIGKYSYSMYEQGLIDLQVLIPITIIVMVIFTILSIIITYNALTNAMLSEYKTWAKIKYVLIIFVLLGGSWAFNGFGLIKAQIVSDSKKHVEFDKDEYMKTKEKLDKKLDDKLSNVLTNIKRFESINIDELAVQLQSLKVTNKHSYYITYIKDLVADGEHLPSIGKKLTDSQKLQLFKQLAGIYKSNNITRLNRKRVHLINEFKRNNIDEIEYLKSISFDSIRNINNNIDKFNDDVVDDNHFNLYLYSFITFIFGIFLELVVLGNDWKTPSKKVDVMDITNTVKIDILQQLANIFAVKNIGGVRDLFLFLDIEIENISGKHVTFYSMINHIVKNMIIANSLNNDLKGFIKINDKYEYDINHLLSFKGMEIPINPDTNKIFWIRNYTKDLKNIIIKHKLNSSNISVDLLKAIYFDFA